MQGGRLGQGPFHEGGETGFFVGAGSGRRSRSFASLGKKSAKRMRTAWELNGSAIEGLGPGEDRESSAEEGQGP